MSVLEPRYSLNDKIKNLLFLLRYKSNPIKLVGSSSLKSQQYFSDFDMMTAINKKDDAESIFHEFEKIIKNIKNDSDVYFLELKIETHDNKKIRYYKNDELDLKTIKDNYNDISFFKIDMSLWNDYKFSDVSVIYQLFSEPLTPEKIQKGIREEIKELMSEHSYYKVLKRKFLLYKINPESNKKKLSGLSKIFNSELGFKYMIISNIEAILLVLEQYNDKHTKERVLINLKLLHLGDYKIRDLESHVKELKKEINDEAKELLPKFPI